MELQIKPFISAEKIQQRVHELGKELTKKFQNKDVVAICVLKGSFMFYSDLIRNIDTDLSL
jgi:hypoxanthine phosphoribosyltransferase